MREILGELVGICLFEAVICLFVPQGDLKKPLQTASGLVLLCAAAKLILRVVGD